jgi:D-alanyl-D-alanine carboxypeptidase
MKTMMDNSPTNKARTAFMADVNDALLSGKSTLDDQGKVTWSAMDPDAVAKVVRKMDLTLFNKSLKALMPLEIY